MFGINRKTAVKVAQPIEMSLQEKIELFRANEYGYRMVELGDDNFRLEVVFGKGAPIHKDNVEFNEDVAIREMGEEARAEIENRAKTQTYRDSIRWSDGGYAARGN
jgi:hypothetical protein